MRIAVCGSSGLLGCYVVKEAESKGMSVIRASRSEGFDLTKEEHAFRVCQRAEAVINCVKAPISTDECEKQMSLAWACNVLVAENLAKACAELGIVFVHVSTDWVFEGKEGELYREDSLPYPQNFYAFTKAIAEERVLALKKDALICRTSGLFGFERRPRNFLYRVLYAKDTLRIPADQYAQPISAKELAKLLLSLLERKERGVFHTVSEEYLSRFELAKLIADVFGLRVKLVPVESKRAIRIPKFLRLSTAKLKAKGYRVLPLKQQIQELKEEWEHAKLERPL